MSRAAVLRRQAETCLQLSHGCSDPLTAEHLRTIAAEFFQSACELEHEGLFERSLSHLGRLFPHDRAQADTGRTGKF